MILSESQTKSEDIVEQLLFKFTKKEEKNMRFSISREAFSKAEFLLTAHNLWTILQTRSQADLSLRDADFIGGTWIRVTWIFSRAFSKMEIASAQTRAPVINHKKIVRTLKKNNQIFSFCFCSEIFSLIKVSENPQFHFQSILDSNKPTVSNGLLY